MTEIKELSDHCSASFGEADDFSEVAETLPAEEQVVLADETDLAFAPAALAAVLAEFTGVGSPEQVGHVVKLNINIFIQNCIYIIYPLPSMQFFPPQPTHYYPLLSLLPLALSGSSLPHLSLLALQFLLRPTTTQNYCNAAVSLSLVPFLMLLNLMQISSLFYSY